MNEVLNTILKSYIDSSNIDYAIMLSGHWGSGKTFYIRNEFYHIVQSLGFNYAYHSLAGEESIANIKKNLIIKLLYRERNDSASSFITNAFEIAQHVPQLKEYVEGAFRIKEYSLEKAFDAFNFEKTIIVIDDIERLSESISQSDVISMIYDCFISKSIHTIFVSDETKISNPNYYIQKEKVIRRSIIFEPKIGDQIDAIVECHYKSKSVGAYYKKNRDLILYVLGIVGLSNLRSIVFLFDHFDVILLHLQTLASELELKTIFENMLLVTFEIKKGNINVGDMNDKNGLDKISLHQYFFDLEKKEEKDKTYAEKFYEKYNKKMRFNYFYIESIYCYLVSGYITNQVLIDDFTKMFRNKEAEEEVPLNLLLSYKEYEHTDLRKAVLRVKYFLELGRYNIFRLGYIYTVLRYIEDQGYCNGIALDYKKIFRKALVKANMEAIETTERIDLSFKNHYFDSTKSNEEVCKYIEKEVERKLKLRIMEIKKAKVEKLFDHIINSNEKLWSFYNSIDGSMIYSDIVETKTLPYLTKINNKGIYFFECILHNDILRVANAGEYGYERKDALLEIKHYLENYINKRLGIMRKRRFLDLIHEINKCIDHLEKTKRAGA